MPEGGSKQLGQVFTAIQFACQLNLSQLIAVYFVFEYIFSSLLSSGPICMSTKSLTEPQRSLQQIQNFGVCCVFNFSKQKWALVAPSLSFSTNH